MKFLALVIVSFVLASVLSSSAAFASELWTCTYRDSRSVYVGEAPTKPAAKNSAINTCHIQSLEPRSCRRVDCVKMKSRSEKPRRLQATAKVALSKNR